MFERFFVSAIYVSLVCKVWLTVVIHIIDSGFQLALPIDVGFKLVKSYTSIMLYRGACAWVRLGWVKPMGCTVFYFFILLLLLN